MTDPTLVRVPARMTDYTEEGAVPVDDAAVDDPPTEEDVRAAQKRKYPGQAETADGRPGDPGPG